MNINDELNGSFHLIQSLQNKVINLEKSNDELTDQIRLLNEVDATKNDKMKEIEADLEKMIEEKKAETEEQAQKKKARLTNSKERPLSSIKNL